MIKKRGRLLTVARFAFWLQRLGFEQIRPNMATRANFNVFRYGKTVKWNFCATSSNFNKLIRASYVFNKWTPLLLKHFEINPLKNVFRLQSIQPEVIFIGYRRISRQVAIYGSTAGSIVHSSRFANRRARLPALLRVVDVPAKFSTRPYFPVPKNRFLQTFDNSYHLVKKALQISSRNNFSPITTRSEIDLAVQASYLQYYELLSRFRGPFYRGLLLRHERRKPLLSVKMKKVVGRMVLGGLENPDYSASNLLKPVFHGNTSLRRDASELLGRSFQPLDSLILGLVTFYDLFKFVSRRVARVSYYIKLIRAILSIKRLVWEGIILARRAGKPHMAPDTRVGFFYRLGNLFRKARQKLRKALKEFKASRRSFKLLKWFRPGLRDNLSVLSHFISISKEISNAPSVFNISSLLSFDRLFRVENFKDLKFSRQLCRVMAPDFFNYVEAKICSTAALKTYFKAAFSRRARKRRVVSSKKRSDVEVYRLRLMLLQLSAAHDASLLSSRKFVKIDVFRPRKIVNSFDYSYSLVSRAVKKLSFFFLQAVKAILKKFVKISKTSLPALAGKSRAKVVVKRLFRSKLISVTFCRLKKLLNSLCVARFRPSVIGPLKLLPVFVDNKVKLYNLLIALTRKFTKFSNPRRVEIGPVEVDSLHLKKIPSRRTTNPTTSRIGIDQIAPYYSFSALKKIRRASDVSLYYEYKILTSKLYGAAFCADVRPLLAGQIPPRLAPSSINKLFKSSFGAWANGPKFIDSLNFCSKNGGRITPYCDDVKEALSIDYSDVVSKDRKELTDSEFRASILFKDPIAFFEGYQGNITDIVMLGPVQLKHVATIIRTKLSDIWDYFKTSSTTGYFTSDDSVYGRPNPTFTFSRKLRRLIRLVDSFGAVLRRAVSALKGLKAPFRAKFAAGHSWPVFNKIAIIVIRFFNNWSTLHKTLDGGEEGWYYRNRFFPIVDRDILRFHRRYAKSKCGVSRKYKLSLAVLSPYYKQFFHYYSAIAPSFSTNSGETSFLKDRIYPHEIFTNSVILHSTQKYFLLKGQNAYYPWDRRPTVSSNFSEWILNHQFDDRLDAQYCSKFRFINFEPVLAFAKNSDSALSLSREPSDNFVNRSAPVRDPYFYYPYATHKELNENRRFIYWQAGNASNVASYLGIRRPRPTLFVINTFKMFFDWINNFLLPRLIENDFWFDPSGVKTVSSIFSFNRHHPGYYLTKLFLQDSISYKKGKLRGSSFFGLILHIMNRNAVWDFNKLMSRLFLITSVAKLKRSSRVDWLAKTSSPFTPEYLAMHAEVLSDLTAAFYGIFNMPVFVKYFPLPVFFASSPQLAKFASKVLSEVGKRGISMDEHTRDWFMEYVYVCHASLVTKSAEGIINFIVKILPYYKKWGDPLALLLNPIGAADLGSLGIRTIKVSLRGRPSGVERARSQNFYFGDVTDPALRQLYTTGSYYYKQCIARTNGGVTTFHMWILS